MAPRTPEKLDIPRFDPATLAELKKTSAGRDVPREVQQAALESVLAKRGIAHELSDQVRDALVHAKPNAAGTSFDVSPILISKHSNSIPGDLVRQRTSVPDIVAQAIDAIQVSARKANGEKIAAWQEEATSGQERAFGMELLASLSALDPGTDFHAKRPALTGGATPVIDVVHFDQVEKELRDFTETNPKNGLSEREEAMIDILLGGETTTSQPSAPTESYVATGPRPPRGRRAPNAIPAGTNAFRKPNLVLGDVPHVDITNAIRPVTDTYTPAVVSDVLEITLRDNGVDPTLARKARQLVINLASGRPGGDAAQILSDLSAIGVDFGREVLALEPQLKEALSVADRSFADKKAKYLVGDIFQGAGSSFFRNRDGGNEDQQVRDVILDELKRGGIPDINAIEANLNAFLPTRFTQPVLSSSVRAGRTRSRRLASEIVHYLTDNVTDKDSRAGQIVEIMKRESAEHRTRVNPLSREPIEGGALDVSDSDDPLKKMPTGQLMKLLADLRRRGGGSSGTEA